MATGTLTRFNSLLEAMAEKVHNLGSDTLKVLLTNAAPAAANTVKADITEIGAGNGYAAGGTQATQASSAQSGGVYTLVLNDVVFTAAGGSIGPFRYVVLYNDTAANDELVGYADYGEPITMSNGEVFTVDFDAALGALVIG